jgi:serine/threonine-protein kinase HipA
MSRELHAYLDGTLTGVFSMTGAGNLSFEYDEGYRLSPTATPVSMSIPLERAEHRNRVALPFLQGLLPDNAQALSAMGSTYGVSATSTATAGRSPCAKAGSRSRAPSRRSRCMRWPTVDGVFRTTLSPPPTS